MFCPKCKAEYREGFTECSDCKVPLVWELPQEPKQEYIEPEPNLEFVTVFATGNPAVIAMAKSILEDAGIQYFVQGETMQFVEGINPAAWPTEIKVGKDDEEEAIKLLENLDESDYDDVG